MEPLGSLKGIRTEVLGYSAERERERESERERGRERRHVGWIQGQIDGI